MAEPGWRARGERYMAHAQDAANRGDDPKLGALVAIYCELRHTEHERGEQADAMRLLAGKVEEHRDELDRLRLR